MHQVIAFGSAYTGLVIGDLTWDICHDALTGAEVATTDAALVEHGGGIYTLVAPTAATAQTVFQVHITATPAQIAEGTFDPETASAALVTSRTVPTTGGLGAEFTAAGLALAPSGSGLTAQQTRDALTLAPTDTPVAGSIDSLIGSPAASLAEDIASVNTRVKAAIKALSIQLRSAYGWDFTQANAVTMTYSGVLKDGQKIILNESNWNDASNKYAWKNANNMCEISDSAQTYTQNETTILGLTALLSLDLTLNGEVLAAGVLTIVVNHSTSGPISLSIHIPSVTVGCCFLVGADGELFEHNEVCGVVNYPRTATESAPGAIEAAAGAGGGASVADMIAGGIAKEATVLGQFGITWGLTYPLVRRDGVINVPRGDVFTITATLNAAFPLAGRTVYLCVQKRKAETNATAIINRAMTITSVANRTVTLTTTAAETALAGQYQYEIEVRDTTTEANPATAEAGTLNIIDDLRK